MRPSKILLLPALLTFLFPAAARAAAQDTAQPVEPAVPAPPVPPPPGDAPSTPTTAPAIDEPEDGAQPPTPATSDNSPLATDGHPLAGYHNGLFYLRDPNDNFRLYIQGRAQIDAYTYYGAGVPDTTLKPTVFLRRIRPEVTGELFHKWWFMLAGDFGATALDNPKGTSAGNTGDPTKAPDATTGLPPQTTRYASGQTARISAQATDVFLNYRPTAFVNVQFGQFDAPFTMENRTSDKYLQFMERPLAVRAVGIPTNKEIGAMVWGETGDRLLYYSVGLFNGDGQNRLAVDSRPEFMGRTFVHPFVSVISDPVMKDIQIGASLRYGAKDKNFVEYDYPGMTTQGNYAFWTPSYKGAAGFTHIIPSGDQLGVGGELRVPVSIFDLTSEFVYIKNNTREAIEGYESTNTERLGDMSGYSYYVQLGFWPIGNRDINGKPGYENMPHVDFSKPDPVMPPRAVQLLVKWEQVALTYASASRAGIADAKNIDGDIKVNAFSIGANYWITKHIRLSANYVLNMFPDSAPTSVTNQGGPVQTSANRAIAPGNTLGKGVNDDARDNAHEVHELLVRAAIAL
jgi:Phosphate-selective porin O and P